MPAGTVVMSRRLVIWLNLACLPLLVVWAVFFWSLTRLLRPHLFEYHARFTSVGDAMVFLGAVAAGMILTPLLVMALHEGVHGLFFWLFTKSRPVFGLKVWYAYASAPGWYLTRGQFLAVSAAPLVVISLVGLGLIAVLPAPAAVLALLGVILNAAGAVGDLFLCARGLAAPASAVVEDQRDRTTFYVPAAAR